MKLQAPLVSALTACIGLCGSPVFAASIPSAYTSAADNLPFGLDRIRWGMSSAEVQLAYPDLKFTSIFDDVPGSAWGPRTLSTSQYRFGDCVFDVTFSFFHARLASVGANSAIDGDALRACRMQVRQDFDSRYGSSGDLYPHWTGPVTNVAYDVPIPRIVSRPIPTPDTRPPGPRLPRPLHIQLGTHRTSVALLRSSMPTTANAKALRLRLLAKRPTMARTHR